MDTSTLLPVLVSDVFETVEMARQPLNHNHITEGGEPAALYVTRTQEHNGVARLIPTQHGQDPNPGNAITIGGATATVFYQPGVFYTGQDILLLRNPRMTEASALVLVSLVRAQMGKFSWGSNGVTLARLRRLRILVPTVDTDNGPEVDWGALESEGERLLRVIRGRISTPVSTREQVRTVAAPGMVFKPVMIQDVFDSCRQAPAWLYVKDAQGEEGGVFPHVTNTLKNNSIHRFLSKQNTPPNPGNAITVGVDTQAVTYQKNPFYGGEALLELRSPYLTEENALVLCAAIRQALTKFSWHHKSSMARVARTRIMVPVTVDTAGREKVDWDSMVCLGQTLLGVVRGRVNTRLSTSQLPQNPHHRFTAAE